VFEALVRRGKKMQVVPSLAESWKQVSPTVWRFQLRRGVKWHDGSAFSADDVVFSIKRAAGDSSTFRVYARAVGEPRRVDDYTVDFTTPVPNPVMLDTLTLLAMVSKSWCEKHRVERAQDFGKKEETYASRNAMGTGPFMLVSREPDVKSVFKRNPAWWGARRGSPRATSTRSSTARSGRRPRAWPRSPRATSISCSIPRCRTSSGSRATRGCASGASPRT
jgi:peptide/nickel transport system substrate-binding protein